MCYLWLCFLLLLAGIFFYGRFKVKVTALLHYTLTKALRCESVVWGTLGFVSLSHLSIRYETISLEIDRVWLRLQGRCPVFCLNYVRIEGSVCDLRFSRKDGSCWSSPLLKSMLCKCMKVIHFEVGSVSVALLDTFPGFLLHMNFEDILLRSTPINWNSWKMSCDLKLFDLKVFERPSAECPSINYLNIANRLMLTVRFGKGDFKLKHLKLECYSPVASFSSGFANAIRDQVEKHFVKGKFVRDGGDVGWMSLLSSISFDLMISRPLVRFNIVGQRNLQLMLSHLSLSVEGSFPRAIQVQLSDLLVVESKLDVVILAMRRFVCDLKLDPSCPLRNSMELFVDCARVRIDYEDFVSCLACVGSMLSGFAKMNQTKTALLSWLSVRLVYSYVQVGLPDNLFATFQFACIYFVRRSPVKSEFGLHTVRWHVGQETSQPVAADFKGKSATHRWGWSAVNGACVIKLHNLYDRTLVQAAVGHVDFECRIEWIGILCNLLKRVYKSSEGQPQSSGGQAAGTRKYVLKLTIDEVSIFIPLFQFEACCLFRFTRSYINCTREMLSTFSVDLAECCLFGVTSSTEELELPTLQETCSSRSCAEGIGIICWKTDYWTVKVCVERSAVLFWSPALHLLLHKASSAFARLKTLLSRRRGKAKAGSRDGGTTKAFWKSSRITVSFSSLLRVCFELPEDHNLEFKLPSAKLSFNLGNPLIEADSLVISCDSHAVFKLTGVNIEKTPFYSMFNVLREYTKVLMSPANSCWIWSIGTLAVVFPYGYHFNAIHEQVINAWKWVRSLHTSGRVLGVPVMWSDWHITIGVISIEICDDPFEVKLRDNYTLMVDEFFEAERRAAILRSKIEEQCLAGSLTSEPDLNELFVCLSKRNASIYVQRSQKLYKGLPSRTSLFRCSWEAVDLKVFADINFLGETRICQQIKSMDPNCPWPNQPRFQTLWCRYVDLNFNEMFAQMRDYPLPYMDIKDGRIAGRLAGCELTGSERSIRTVNFALGHKFGFSTLQRHIGVLKYFYDFSSKFRAFRWSYGPCWEPCLAMINSCLALIRRPSLDPSPPLPFWDRARLLLHGRLRLLSDRLVLALLASSNPYNDTEQLEWTWEKLLFEWKSGNVLLKCDFDLYVRTASKYDDCRLFHFPNLKLNLRFDWACLGNPHNHNAVTLCAPDKLPDRSADQLHDSYGAFRSQHLNLTFVIDVHEKRDCTDSLCVLLFSNTFRWLVGLRDTVSAINRPVKRGSLYSNSRTPKTQLSRHYKKLDISISLPTFLVTYWPSFSSDRGVHFTCSALQLSSAHELHLEDFTSPELLHRRKRTRIRTTFLNAKMGHVDCYLLGNCPDHCIDERKSFFVGIDKLTYCRELIDFNGVPVTAHHVVVRNVKAIWTAFNRDIVLYIYDNIEKGKIHRRNLSTDALKLVIDSDSTKTVQQKKKETVPKPFVQAECSSIKLLQKLIDEANTKSVAYCEENSDRKRHKLTGVHLCQEDDVLFSKWQVELISMQVALKGCDTAGYLLCTAAHGKILNRIHQPIWRANQLLGKSTWVTRFTGMQYFATVNPAGVTSKASTASPESPCATSSDVPEFKFLDVALLNLDAESPGRTARSAAKTITESELLGNAEQSPLRSVSPTVENVAPCHECSDHQLETNVDYQMSNNDLSYVKSNSLPFDSQWLSSLDQVQWLGKDLIEESFSSDKLSDVVTSVINEGDSAGGVIYESSLRDASLQRIISRCSCELMICCFTENFEPSELGILHVSARECDGITECEPDDCVTLIHPKLDIHTSYDQYSMILDVVNNLILYVDPNKKKSAENLLKFRFNMQIQSLDDLRPYILSLQNEVRCLWAQNKDIELAMYHMHPHLKDHPELVSRYLDLARDLEESKANLSLKNEDLHIAIRCFKEKKLHGNRPTENVNYDLKSAVARRFEVSIEEAQWCLTEANGQLGLAQLQLENFLYTKVSRINDSGEHMFEINSLKIINLLPNSPFKEVLHMQEKRSVTHKPAVLIVCRQLAPVGGITVLEHLEVSVKPMIVQMTYVFFHTMMKFFFPNRNIETAEESVRSNAGSTGHRKKKKRRSKFALIRKSMMPRKRKLIKEPRNYIDLMKLRAMKNILFMNVRVNEVPIVVTYKGATNGYIDNFKNLELTFPLIEYHNQNWTWLDLAVGIKAKSLRVLIKQVVRRKLMKPHLADFLGGRKAESYQELRDEDKKRMILGPKLVRSLSDRNVAKSAKSFL